MLSKAIYINLDASYDRRRHIDAQLAQLSLPYERMAAIEFDDQNPDPGQVAYLRRGIADYVQHEISAHSRRGVIGCYLSHVAVLESLASKRGNPDDMYLIVEDDATFSPGFVDKVRERLPHVPSDWTILKVGGFGRFRDRDRVNAFFWRATPPGREKTGRDESGRLFYEYYYGGAHALITTPRRASIVLEALAKHPICDYDGALLVSVPGVYATEHLSFQSADLPSCIHPTPDDPDHLLGS